MIRNELPSQNLQVGRARQPENLLERNGGGHPVSSLLPQLHKAQVLNQNLNVQVFIKDKDTKPKTPKPLLCQAWPEEEPPT